MGFIGSLFGSSTGMGFEPERAASPEQAELLFKQQQQALQRQRAFATALGAQTPQAIANQQMLANQLAQATQGVGPSVAQSQLAQATGQNIAAQQALMAGQRGASANVGQMARQAALVGARTQQQAAGQAATLRAQEQLAAREQLGGLTGQQLGQVQQAQAQQMQGALAGQQNILGAIAARNAAKAGIQQQIAQSQGALFGGLLGGVGAMMAEGGEVKKEEEIGSENYWERFKKGYEESTKPQMGQSAEYAGAQQFAQAVGKGLGSLFKSGTSGKPGGGYAGANLGVSTQMPQVINPMATSQAIGAMKLPFKDGGAVPAMVSPGEKYLPPSEVKQVAEGKKLAHKAGETIPGKAKVKGDSYANDTVKKTLKEGGIVIPRSVMQSDDPAEKARQFVAAVLAKKQMKRD